MGRKRESHCVVRTNRNGHLYFDITWDRRWREGTTWSATAENRRKAERFSERIDRAIRAGKFDGNIYLGWFPNGTRADEFRPVPLSEERRSERTLRE